MQPDLPASGGQEGRWSAGSFGGQLIGVVGALVRASRGVGVSRPRQPEGGLGLTERPLGPGVGGGAGWGGERPWAEVELQAHAGPRKGGLLGGPRPGWLDGWGWRAWSRPQGKGLSQGRGKV